MNTYSQLSIAELRALAKERKISGYSALRKQELIDALTASDNGSTSVEQKAPEAAKTEEKAAKPAKPAEAAGRTAEAPRPVVRRVVRSVQGSQAQQGQSGERSQERFQYQAGERRQERPQQAGERPQGQQFQGGAGRPADPTDSGIIRRRGPEPDIEDFVVIVVGKNKDPCSGFCMF